MHAKKMHAKMPKILRAASVNPRRIRILIYHIRESFVETRDDLKYATFRL